MTANSYDVSVLLGNGDGTFQAARSIGSNPESVAVGDFNGDGKLDLVTVNDGSSNVSVLLGDGAGGFGAAQNYAVGTFPISVVLADFNHDTHLDIVTANAGHPRSLRLYRAVQDSGRPPPSAACPSPSG